MQTINHLKAIRERRGVGAAELARLCGISRQTVYAIEAGSFVPNTAVALQLAHFLDVTVEELFQADCAPAQDPAGVRADFLSSSAQPFAGQPVRFCRVGRRLVSVPVEMQPVYLPPADAMIQTVQPGASEVTTLSFAAEGALAHRLLIAGCDPGMSILSQHLAESADIELISAPCASRQALDWLKQGRIHIAGTHLSDPHSGEFNLPIVRQIFPRGGCRVITFALWEEGFVVQSGNPKGIRSAADLANRRVTIVNREPGAGSRHLLDRLLDQMGVPAAKVRGYSTVASGHLPAAWKVLSGEADVCIATRLAARAMGLDFIPLALERYDLVVARRYADDPLVDRLFDALNRASLRHKLAALAGYDVSHTGESRV